MLENLKAESVLQELQTYKTCGRKLRPQKMDVKDLTILENLKVLGYEH
jgi:hypothetical protein